MNNDYDDGAGAMVLAAFLAVVMILLAIIIVMAELVYTITV